MNAAAQVFAERGYKDATTRMICAEADVNVALVNYYFKSKAELYKAVIAILFENVAKPMMSIPNAVRDEATWREAICLWVRRAIAICAATEPPEIGRERWLDMVAEHICEGVFARLSFRSEV